MDLPQIAPLPTERSLIFAGIERIESGGRPTPNQRAVMIRWSNVLPDEIRQVILDEPPVLRVVPPLVDA